MNWTGTETVGWLYPDDVETDALPRIGEVVDLTKVLPNDLPLNSFASYMPKVLNVEHFVKPGGTGSSISVSVGIVLSGNLETLKAVAQANDLRWLENTKDSNSYGR